MSPLQCFRDLITERLTVAAEEIFGYVERTVVEYEEELHRQRKLLEMVCRPRVKLQRIEHVCKEESSLDQEEPEPLQSKEEQEADTLMLTPVYEDHMEPEPERDHLQLLPHSSPVAQSQNPKWGPFMTLHRTELRQQQHVYKEEETCTSPEGDQFEVKQEADASMWTLDHEERDHMEPEPDPLLSHGSPVARGQDQTGSRHLDSLSSRNSESKTHNRNKVEHYRTSEIACETHAVKTFFKCDTCGKSFAHRSKLIAHMRIHTGEKPFSCTACAKRFRSNNALLFHMRSHTGEKPYTCNTCGKCFVQRSHLIAHERIHSGEKPYTCKTCGKRFNQGSNMKSHERIHTGVKLFTCNTCGKSFIRDRDLIIHGRIHSGEKPFACKTCGKCFSQGSNLSAHERIHSREALFL